MLLKYCLARAAPLAQCEAMHARSLGHQRGDSATTRGWRWPRVYQGSTNLFQTKLLHHLSVLKLLRVAHLADGGHSNAGLAKHGIPASAAHAHLRLRWESAITIMKEETPVQLLDQVSPHADIHLLFQHYNSVYFDNALGAARVEWSSARMTR